MGKIVDRNLELSEIALGRPDGSLDHGKLGRALRREIFRPRYHHGDVEMVLQQIGRLDRLLVRSVNQDDALAVESDERNVRLRLCRSGEQGRHFGRALRGILRPAGILANVDEADCGFARLRDFGKDRCFLRARHEDGILACRELAETVKLGSAKLAAGSQIRIGAGAAQCIDIERHGVLAGTHHNLPLLLCHSGSEFARAPRLTLASDRLAIWLNSL